MNSERFINENFPQDKAQQFADILKNAISSYIENRNNCTVNEWLFRFLSTELPEKNTDEITAIANQIINTVELHENTITSMQEALSAGKSVEAWFQEETSTNERGVGEQAYELVDAHAALTTASNQYVDQEEQHEVIDVEVISPEEWEDSKWNRYKMRDLVTETVRQAGDTAIRVTANDLFEKVTEYGFQTVINDTDLIKESLTTGVSTGLKVAAAGAMEIANARGVLPEFESDTESRSLIACMAIENLKTFGKISNGEIGLAEGLKEVANNSVATLATIVKAKVAAVGTKVGQKIGATVGAVFGPIGTAVGHFVGGAVGKIAGTEVGSKIVETAKKVSSAAKSVVSKITSTVKSVGNKIKSGLKKLFSW